MIRHVAFIMDGNSTWAKKNNVSDLDGHLAGMKSLAKLICKIKIPYATFYAFSTENWKRPKVWIDGFMSLALRFLETDPLIKDVLNANIKLKVIGNKSSLPQALQNVINKYEEITVNNTGTVIQLAISYGGRDEIIRAVKKLNNKNIEINEENLSNALDTAGIPDPDLVIRTSGKKRLSNFLLWQVSYSEFYSTYTLWPDFCIDDFNIAVVDYEKRHRTFGLSE